MNHDAFVAAAFGVTALGTLWLLLSSWLGMRKTEALSNDLKNER
jgi:hypothetical protein